MADRLTVTGYGRTEAEAEANARSQIDTLRTADDAFAMSVGAMGLGLRVVTGYLQLAWAFALSFSVRPISTLLGTLAIGFGLTMVWVLLALIFGSDAPAREPSGFERVLGFVVMVIVGSGFAAGIAPVLLPLTALFEDVEMSLLRRLPLSARAPVILLARGWPLLVPVIIVGFQAGWSWSATFDLLASWSFGAYLLLGLIYLGLQGIVLAACETASPLAREFNWYGAPLTGGKGADAVEPPPGSLG